MSYRAFLVAVADVLRAEAWGGQEKGSRVPGVEVTPVFYLSLSDASTLALNSSGRTQFLVMIGSSSAVESSF